MIDVVPLVFLWQSDQEVYSLAVMHFEVQLGWSNSIYA
jgi:hypothetical protein